MTPNETMDAKQRDRERSREYQRRRRAAMTAEDRKRESERVRAIQKRHGPHRWVYEPTSEKLAAARERVKRWKAQNPEADLNRRARRRAAQIDTDVDRYWLRVLRADPCSYCGDLGGHIDHIVPISRGGPHCVSNLTSACRACNSSKNRRPLLAFLNTKGGASHDQPAASLK
jgi:5-methylcytosine-specific restriction endonuclease McrA